MNNQRKLRVGVIFGGRSGEHEVSLRSARSVLDALDKAKYEILPIGITKEGGWLVGDTRPMLDDGPGKAAGTTPVILPPDPARHQLISLETTRETRPVEIDVMIPVLHGTFGEDGTVQGLLELAGIPYVGAGVVGSAVGMDKAIFKQVMTASGIPIVPWVLIRAADLNREPKKEIARVEQSLTYPVFTKPANLGSSVGIRKCRNRNELKLGLEEAAKFDRRIVVEQGIDARELEVSVLGNDFPRASVVGEVKPRRDFYDYEAKYVTDDSELLIPAPISNEIASQVRQLALTAFQSIDCAGLGRVDFLLDKENEALYINEINTIPGFTSISMYPKLWEASGLPYSDLLDQLIGLALERYQTRAQLHTDFKLMSERTT